MTGRALVALSSYIFTRHEIARKVIQYGLMSANIILYTAAVQTGV